MNTIMWIWFCNNAWISIHTALDTVVVEHFSIVSRFHRFFITRLMCFIFSSKIGGECSVFGFEWEKLILLKWMCIPLKTRSTLCVFDCDRWMYHRKIPLRPTLCVGVNFIFFFLQIDFQFAHECFGDITLYANKMSLFTRQTSTKMCAPPPPPTEIFERKTTDMRKRLLFTWAAFQFTNGVRVAIYLSMKSCVKRADSI